MAIHMAQFRVSMELIRDAFAMPAESVIYNIKRHDFIPDVFVFYVEHPSLPTVIDGWAPVEINPTLTIIDFYKRPIEWLRFDFNLSAQQPNAVDAMPSASRILW